MSFTQNWLVQSLLANIAWVLLVAAWGAVIGYLKYVDSRWAGIAMYTLGAAVLMLLMIQLFRLPSFFPEKQDTVTTANIEEHLRQWADDFGLAQQKVDIVQGVEKSLQLLVTTRNGKQIVIFRTDKKSRMLTFASALSLSAEHQAIWNRLDVNNKNIFLDDLRLELARARVGVEVSISTLESKVSVAVPIRPQMDGADFTRALDEVDTGVEVARGAIIMGLRKYPQPTP